MDLKSYDIKYKYTFKIDENLENKNLITYFDQNIPNFHK